MPEISGNFPIFLISLLFEVSPFEKNTKTSIPRLVLLSVAKRTAGSRIAIRAAIREVLLGELLFPELRCK